MIPTKPFLVCFVCLGLLAGCAPVAVQWDYDPDIDFSQYKTFAWMPRKDGNKRGDPALANPFLEKRIKKSAVEGLATRGFQADRKDPDFLIAYYITFKKKKTVDVYRYGYRGPREVDVHHYKEGTLVLDFVDAGTRQLIWRGWGSDAFRPVGGPEEQQKNIDRIVDVILGKFPPYEVDSKNETPAPRE
ncbi:MAG: DUF4136 domain-containing protein [Gemmatimonadetes bacterium]|jgi:hypothetical protein|nr:DUF4136 domain-containing protein [Gemmatimonadota bacterium]